jgi:PIN domain nuclease of toxin-antitoxin system
MIYLDTHVLVWLDAKKHELFPKSVRKLLEGEEDLFVSPAVYLEIEYLYEAGKIREHAQTVFDSLLARTPLQFCRLSFADIARKAATLAWTRDPFDRLIVASALSADAVLLTKDQEILANYSKARWK